MKLQEFLKQGKDDYLSVKTPERISLYGWLELRDRLDKKFRLRDIFVWFGLRPAALIVLETVFLLATTTAIFAGARVSAPGETLYPVKRFYENIASSVVGNDELKIEGRAQDIILLSQKEKENSEKLKEAVIEYGVTVARVENETQGVQRDELRQRLDRHGEEFRRIYEEDKNEDIKPAIEATHINGEEVKGEKDEEHSEDNEPRD
jgi:hypothetical protein